MISTHWQPVMLLVGGIRGARTAMVAKNVSAGIKAGKAIAKKIMGDREKKRE